jgi:hypothetical protein
MISEKHQDALLFLVAHFDTAQKQVQVAAADYLIEEVGLEHIRSERGSASANILEQDLNKAVVRRTLARVVGEQLGRN